MSLARIVGIDYGLKRIGLAISDANCLIAGALKSIVSGKNSKETIHKILEALQPYTIKEIVVGNPIHMNGKIGFLADEVHYFIELLKQHVSCPVLLWDERLTTAQAERALKEGGMRRKRRSQLVDSISAVILLQSYLGY
ncbi:MAG: Holliday junction resolvase RuvX [Chlamydiales bacterium]